MFARQAKLWALLVAYLLAVNAAAGIAYRHWTPVSAPTERTGAP